MAGQLQHILPELQDEVTFLWRDTREETHDWTQHQTTVGRHHLLHQSHLKTKMDSDLKRDGLPYSEDYTKFEPKLVKLIERNRQPGPFGLRTKVVWGNVFLISLIHVFGVCGMCLAPLASWHTWIFFCFYYLISGFAVTGGAHRLWAHKSYKARLPFKIIVMLCNCISFQNDILEWCRDHRLHHKFTETDADPHNAKRGFFFAHMGWLMMWKHPEVIIKGRQVDMSDLRSDPVVMFQRKYYFPLSLVCSVFIPTAIPMYFWGETFWISLLMCGFFRYICTLHVTWLVNSAAHLWGKRPYDKGINPSENWFVSLSAIGEGFHNYHHCFPYDYAASEWGPTFNITTIIIDFCGLLGLVYDRKQVSSESIIRIRKRLGDLASSCTSN